MLRIGAKINKKYKNAGAVAAFVIWKNSTQMTGAVTAFLCSKAVREMHAIGFIYFARNFTCQDLNKMLPLWAEFMGGLKQRVYRN